MCCVRVLRCVCWGGNAGAKDKSEGEEKSDDERMKVRIVDEDKVEMMTQNQREKRERGGVCEGGFAPAEK